MDPFLTSRIVTDVLGGLTNGVIFGMVALSLVLIWRSTGVLNFEMCIRDRHWIVDQ